MRKGTAALILLLGVPSAVAQPLPELIPGLRLVTDLTSAVSLRVDPAGRLYIADSGRHVVDVRDPEGSPVSVIGGPGTGGEQFDSPMDVDPTNGLIVVVADAGNHRVARFSSQGQLLESTALYGDTRARPGESASVMEDDDLEGDVTPGRPVAVTLNEANETYAIDETRNVVAKWDTGRRLVTLFGDDSGSGPLLRPVDLEVIGDQLYVADAEASSVMVYDLFGTFVYELGGGRLSDLRGLGSRGRDLWVLHGNRLSVFSSEGTREADYRLPREAAEAVDVATTRKWVYVVTGTDLFRWDLDALGRPPTHRD